VYGISHVTLLSRLTATDRAFGVPQAPRHWGGDDSADLV